MSISALLGAATAPSEEQLPETKSKAVDVFEALGALFADRPLDQVPQPFIMHRFLASDPKYAVIAKHVQMTTNDPQMVYELWRSIVGGTRMGRFTYVGPKTQAGAEGLTLAIMQHASKSREEAEDIVQLLDGAGKLPLAMGFFGIETEADKKAAKPKRKTATKKKK